MADAPCIHFLCVGGQLQARMQAPKHVCDYIRISPSCTHSLPYPCNLTMLPGDQVYIILPQELQHISGGPSIYEKGDSIKACVGRLLGGMFP